ncbi:MAG: hypothetical protein HYR85_09245 [Planctomycetes bacterium]|nr:hypothetical protein [Planctomycetota bacterium]
MANPAPKPSAAPKPTRAERVKARPERAKARAERLTKKVAEMEKKIGKRTGDPKLRMFRKQMKRAQRRRTDFFPKPKPGEGDAKPA